jgi:hypothetical protein
MRCSCLREGHIAAVELLDVKSDEEAVEKCSKALRFWDRARKIAHGPPREDDGPADG